MCEREKRKNKQTNKQTNECMHACINTLAMSFVMIQHGYSIDSIIVLWCLGGHPRHTIHNLCKPLHHLVECHQLALLQDCNWFTIFSTQLLGTDDVDQDTGNHGTSVQRSWLAEDADPPPPSFAVHHCCPRGTCQGQSGCAQCH